MSHYFCHPTNAWWNGINGARTNKSRWSSSRETHLWDTRFRGRVWSSCRVIPRKFKIPVMRRTRRVGAFRGSPSCFGIFSTTQTKNGTETMSAGYYLWKRRNVIRQKSTIDHWWRPHYSSVDKTDWRKSLRSVAHCGPSHFTPRTCIRGYGKKQKTKQKKSVYSERQKKCKRKRIEAKNAGIVSTAGTSQRESQGQRPRIPPPSLTSADLIRKAPLPVLCTFPPPTLKTELLLRSKWIGWWKWTHGQFIDGALGFYLIFFLLLFQRNKTGRGTRQRGTCFRSFLASRRCNRSTELCLSHRYLQKIIKKTFRLYTAESRRRSLGLQVVAGGATVACQTLCVFVNSSKTPVWIMTPY